MSEINRLNALENTRLLDSNEEERFDRIVRLASGAMKSEVALISLIDKDRQWFKARQGLDVKETPRNQAFCHHAIQTPDEVTVVLNANIDDRFAANPLVTGDPNIAFYAGAPLVTKDGYALGTLCIIDSTPREEFSESDQQMLKDLASTVMTEVELVSQNQINSDLTLINEELQHRMGNMYAHISSIVNMLARTNIDRNQFILRVREKISSLSKMQSLLARRNYHSVPFSELASVILSSFEADRQTSQIDIQAHDDFDVSARGAFILTLMINELGTNAIKYGALTNVNGRINLSWTDGDEIILDWKETGLDGLFNDENRTGFGSQILKKIVPMDLQGVATYDVQPDGVHYRVSAQAARLKFSNEHMEMQPLNAG